MGNDSEPSDSARVTKLNFKAPPFWPSRPALWFAQVESQFILTGIVSDEIKYHCVISSLDGEVLAVVADLLAKPPSKDLYLTVKNRILQQYTESQAARLRTLLQELELADKKPSRLLLEMKELANGHLDDEALKNLFLQRLPVAMQQILAVSNEGPDKLAAMADVINTVSPTQGLDFLNAYGFIVDLNKHKITCGYSTLSLDLRSSKVTESGFSVLQIEQPYAELLARFPRLTQQERPFDVVLHSTQHFIETTGQPVYSTVRRLSPVKLKIAQQEFNKLLDLGICRPSKSSWASPLVVAKKNDGSWRMVGDYGKLNKITVPDRFPIPHVQDFVYNLNGKKFFSTIDLVRAYHHIPVAEQDVPKTAIITPFGLFEFIKMSFSLRNAAATFQRFIYEIVRGLDYCFPYLDDILVASTSYEEHLQHLRELFQRLNEYGVSIKIQKCAFGQERVKFLGHIITSAGIEPLPERVQAIVDYTEPSTIAELRGFLGLVNFYHRFLPNIATIQMPLNKLLKEPHKRDKRPVEWTEEAVQAFQKCKNALVNCTSLTHPSTTAPLALFVDASDYAIGAALQQLEPNGWRPLAFFSRKLSLTECNYSTYDRELLAIYAAIKHFLYLLEGRSFTIFTDHKPLTFMFVSRSKHSSPRQTRQISYISQFSTDVRHVSGAENIPADFLSRINQIYLPDVIDFIALAQDQQQDDELKELLEDDKFQFKKVSVPNSNLTLQCEFSFGVGRPYLTKPFRYSAWRAVHKLSHPSNRTTVKMVAERYFWPKSNRDIAVWTRACQQCQKSKITRHVNSPLGQFPIPLERFEVVHIDLVGPLPSSEGMNYCLTCVDRFTRWPEAFPLKEITAEAVARAFYAGWISRYGVPHKIITDQGRQFESALFREFAKLVGMDKARTTAYHPQCNGLVERFHRQLKAAIRCHETQAWTEVLPTVLLGFRVASRSTSPFSAAQMLYGEGLRIPGEFHGAQTAKPITEFTKKLMSTMTKLQPVIPSERSPKKTFLFRELGECTHAWLRIDHVKPSLTPPYKGPYEIIFRADKVYDLLINNKRISVSVDRIKPTFFQNETDSNDPPEIQVRKVRANPGPVGRASTESTAGRIETLPTTIKIEPEDIPQPTVEIHLDQRALDHNQQERGQASPEPVPRLPPGSSKETVPVPRRSPGSSKETVPVPRRSPGSSKETEPVPRLSPGSSKAAETPDVSPRRLRSGRRIFFDTSN